MTPPNIVLIMTDQQRADFFRSEGFAWDTMPFLESLSQKGARFRRAYTPTPVCGPARTSLFTGRFPKATRVRENWGLHHVTRSRDLIAVLRERGYSINLAGKNHTYLKPEDFDFYSSYGHVGGGRIDRKTPVQVAFDRWLEQLNHKVSLKPTPFPLEAQLPVRVVDDAIECINSITSENTGGERPFFLWLSFAEPHNPYQVPEPYFSMFPEEEAPERVAGIEAVKTKGERWRWLQRLIEEKLPDYDQHWRRYRANYCGMLRLIDDQIKRFVEHLDERGILDQTILVFTSDHGDYAGDYGLQRKGVGLPECLVRVPLLIVGPKVVAQDVRDEFVSLVDLMPTLCEAVGADIPYGVQGRSLWPMLTGQSFPTTEFMSIYAEVGYGGAPYREHERPELHFSYEGEYFDELNTVTQSGNLKMVRKGDWKLLMDSLGNGELYDLKADPGELNNLFDDPAYRDICLDLTKELLKWTIRTDDDLPTAKYRPKQAPRNWLWGQ